MAFQALVRAPADADAESQAHIEAHGFQGKIVRSWGAFSQSGGVMVGLLLRYGTRRWQ